MKKKLVLDKSFNEPVQIVDGVVYEYPLKQVSIMPTLKIQKLTPTAKIPTKTNPTDSGYDLYCDYILIPTSPSSPVTAYNITPAVSVEPKQIVIVSTGIKATVAPNWELQIRPRSGLALRGITVNNAPGTVDEGYRGEIKVVLINHGRHSIEIKQGDRIAQMVPCPVYNLEIEECELDDTVRGVKGFASSGR